MESDKVENEVHGKMNCTIREAGMQDVTALAYLSNQLGYASNAQEIQQRLEALLATSDNCVFVAQQEEKILGWIHGFYALRVESNPFVEIGGLVVEEKARKMGIGRQLVERIEQWAETKLCKDVRVRCNILRKESHMFYEGLEFVEIKVQKIYGKKLP